MATEEDFVFPTSSRLCATCQGISLVEFTVSEGRQLPHHETSVSFDAAIKEGCYICTRVGEELSSQRDEEVDYLESKIVVEQNLFSMYRVLPLEAIPLVIVHITLRSMYTRFVRFVFYPSESKFICD
jgi:hypothetical protein